MAPELPLIARAHTECNTAHALWAAALPTPHAAQHAPASAMARQASRTPCCMPRCRAVSAKSSAPSSSTARVGQSLCVNSTKHSWKQGARDGDLVRICGYTAGWQCLTGIPLRSGGQSRRPSPGPAGAAAPATAPRRRAAPPPAGCTASRRCGNSTSSRSSTGSGSWRRQSRARQNPKRTCYGGEVQPQPHVRSASTVRTGRRPSLRAPAASSLQQN